MACWPYREPGSCWGPGGLELLLGLELLPGHWSAARVLSLLRDGRNLLARALRPHWPHWLWVPLLTQMPC